MTGRPSLFHHVVTAIASVFIALLLVLSSNSVRAQGADGGGGAALEALFADLARTDSEAWLEAEAEILRRWAHSGSAVVDYLTQKGEAALDEGDAARAVDHLSAALDTAPQFPRAYYLRAEAYAQLGLTGPAAADLAQALAIEPRHFLALTALGLMLDEINAPEAALRALDRSVEINPHQQDALDARERIRHKADGLAL